MIAPFSPKAIFTIFLFFVFYFYWPHQVLAQSGPIIVGDNTVGCTGANAGGIHYVTATNLLEYCNGTAWTAVGSGGSSLWTAGAGNDIYYNTGTYQVGIGVTDPLTTLHIQSATTAELRVENTGDSNSVFALGGNRSSADTDVGEFHFRWNGNTVARIKGKSGTDTTNKDEGWLDFQTRNDGDGATVSRMVISKAGNVGIGMTDPLWPLHVFKSNTTTTNAAQYGMFTQLDIAPTGDSGASASWYRSAANAYAKIPNTNTKTWRTVSGMSATAENNSTVAGATATLRGGDIGAINTAAATINYIDGLQAWAENDAGTVSEMHGAAVWTGVGGGTVDESSALYLYMEKWGGTVNKMYGIHLDHFGDSGQTVGNRYGIYLDSFSGTSSGADFGIYQLGGANNYFAGNTGIGTANPSSELHLHTSSTTNYIELLLTNPATGTTAADGTLLGLDANALNAYLWNKENGYLYFGTNDAERMRIASNGNVGIGDTNPGATLTVNGSIATTPPSIINLTADNTLVTTAGRSYIRLTSNNTTATNRTYCLDAGTEGQILVLEWTSGTNKGELVDDGTSCTSSVAAKLSATWTPAAADATLQLIYRAATPQKWLELSRSAN